jgi:diadenosine tetraphosphate (Ap4A) HIT family hydrolase
MTDFVLDPRLEADTRFVADWPLCRVLLMDDARYPWLILVPRKAGMSEWFDLSAEDQLRAAREALSAARQLKVMAAARKMNVAALGNMVAQLHIHIVARVEGDPAWPGPVWGAGTRQPYTDDGRHAMVAKLSGLAAP